MQQILRKDIRMSIAPAPFRPVAVVDGLYGTDMQAAEAVHAAMLPDGMTVRPRNILARANPLA